MSTKTTPNVRSPAITSDSSSAITQRVLGHGERLSVELPTTVDELKNWLIDQENHLARESARQGFGFLVLKQELGEGEFARWLVEHDFKEQRVYENISIAKMLLAAPASVQPLLMGLGKMKLIELARLPNETIDEVAESGALDELSRLSVRELKEQVRGLKTLNQSMTADLKALQQLSETLKAQPAGGGAVDEVTHFASGFIRTTALAEDWIDRGLNELYPLQAELCTHFSSVQNASSQRIWEALACHLYTIIASLYSRLRTLLDQLTLDLPESALGGLAVVDSRLSDQQLTDIVQARHYQAHQAEQERMLHQAAAQFNGPRKRGRPKKLSPPNAGERPRSAAPRAVIPSEGQLCTTTQLYCQKL